MPQRVRLAVGVAAIGLVAITGCSSSGSSPSPSTSSPTAVALNGPAYSLALNAISVSEEQAHQALEAAMKSKTVAQVRAGLSAFADEQDSAAQRLLTLRPPADAASAHAALAKAFTDTAAAIRVLVGQLTDVKTVKEALSLVGHDNGASAAGDKIDAALDQLEKLGYT